MNELEQWVDQCRTGDALAWEAVVRETQGRVFGLALQFLRSREEAADLTQEVFIRVYQRLDQFSGGDFMPWLLRLTRNACIDALRRRKVRPPAEDKVIEDSTPLVDGTPDLEAQCFENERQKIVYRAMDNVSELNREILLLKDIQGLDLQQISDMLKLPLGTIKSRSHRARVELAKRIVEIEPDFAASFAGGAG